MRTPSNHYYCERPVYHSTGQCVVCSGMLARGDFARDVAEVQYAEEQTNRFYEPLDRYQGLDARNASALSDALWHDLPGSLCLNSLRVLWNARNDAAALGLEEWDEQTTVSAPPCCDGLCRGPATCEMWAERNG